MVASDIQQDWCLEQIEKALDSPDWTYVDESSNRLTEEGYA